MTSRPLFPQALTTSLHHRLSTTENSLFSNLSTSRSAKRQAAAKVNYNDDYPDVDFEDNNGTNNPEVTQQYSGVNDIVMEIDDGRKNEDEDDDDYYDDEFNYINSTNITNTSKNNPNLGQKEAPKEIPEEYLVPNASFSKPTIVPIRIKINTNGAVINDSFLYNLNETIITPEIISSMIAQDLDLHKNTETLVLNSIKDQIQSFQDLINNPNNQIINQFLSNEKEFHIILDVSCNIGELFFTDKIEWNLLDDSMTPELFAKTVVEDMGLNLEFENIIAIAIYDEIYKFKREIIENPQQLSQTIDSLPFFNLVVNNDDASSPVQGLRYDLKKYGEEFSPTIEKLSEWEIEKRETEKERNLRRRKRETLKFAGMR